MVLLGVRCAAGSRCAIFRSRGPYNVVCEVSLSVSRLGSREPDPGAAPAERAPRAEGGGGSGRVR